MGSGSSKRRRTCGGGSRSPAATCPIPATGRPAPKRSAAKIPRLKVRPDPRQGKDDRVRKEILPIGSPAANAPYSPVVRAGGLLYISGQVGTGADGRLVEGGFEAQCRQCLKRLEELLKEAGASLDHVVRTTAFLTDMGDYAALNDMYREAFPTDRPARTCIQVAGLPLGAIVEIEALAVAPE
ncbi:MAG: RidA family protein [Armatimonadetes bacterium]|nr:RidA family protein [Armatimonadota bacterium]